MSDEDLSWHRDKYVLACMKHGKTLQEAVVMAYRKYRYPLVPNPLSMVDHYSPVFWAIHDIYGDERMRNDPKLNAESYEFEVKLTPELQKVLEINRWIENQEPRVAEILRKVEVDTKVGKLFLDIPPERFMTEFCLMLAPIWKHKLVQYGCQGVYEN